MTTIDTNVLVRALVDDNSAQGERAVRFLSSSEMCVIPTIVLCEVAWVLRSRYQQSRSMIALLFESIYTSHNIVCDRDAVQFGVSALRAGADFADAVIAKEGERLGGSTLLPFDRRAVRHLSAAGMRAQLLT